MTDKQINNRIIAALLLAITETMKTMKVKPEDEKRWYDLISMNFKNLLKK